MLFCQNGVPMAIPSKRHRLEKAWQETTPTLRHRQPERAWQETIQSVILVKQQSFDD